MRDNRAGRALLWGATSPNAVGKSGGRRLARRCRRVALLIRVNALISRRPSELETSTLASPRRRRRCGPSLHETPSCSRDRRWSGAQHTRRSNNNTRALAGFLKVGGVAPFLEIEAKKGTRSARASARHLLFQALVVIPMAAKDCLGFKSLTPAISLALQNLYASLERVECGLAEPAGLRVLDCVGTAVVGAKSRR